MSALVPRGGYCAVCGAARRPGARVCVECGEPLAQDTPTGPPQIVNTNVVVVPTPPAPVPLLVPAMRDPSRRPAAASTCPCSARYPTHRCR
jgi:predicted amidophosphoribosyltransferase